VCKNGGLALDQLVGSSRSKANPGLLGTFPYSDHMILSWYPPQWNSRLGFIKKTCWHYKGCKPIRTQCKPFRPYFCCSKVCQWVGIALCFAVLMGYRPPQQPRSYRLAIEPRIAMCSWSPHMPCPWRNCSPTWHGATELELSPEMVGVYLHTAWCLAAQAIIVQPTNHLGRCQGRTPVTAGVVRCGRGTDPQQTDAIVFCLKSFMYLFMIHLFLTGFF
jgi:hypothetical protein